MTSVRGRGRGMGGGGGRGGANGGSHGSNRGRPNPWQNGPPGSNGSFSGSRGGSPASSSPAPRQSINDHMNVMGKVVDDKARSASAKTFKTDTDISGSSAGGARRELQPWAPDATDPAIANGARSNGAPASKDAETFGFGGPQPNIPWDQFDTNEKLFGATSNYHEDLYTTKLNRGGADYKQREKEAAKLASEIMGQTSANTHVAEERGYVADGAANEEDKYSGVQRAPNAYVPPAARRTTGQGPGGRQAPTGPAAATASPAISASTVVAKTNGAAPTPTHAPVSAAVPAPATAQPAATKDNASIAVPSASTRRTSDIAKPSEKEIQDLKKATPSPKPTSTDVVPETAKLDAQPEDKTQPTPTVVDQFRHFVGTEREKVEAKKQSMMKQDRERVMAEFKKFGTSFTVPLPMPKDILPLLAKDEEKQKAIQQKAADAFEASKRKPEPVKPVTTPQSRKISMKISEIPPFKPKASAQASPAPRPPVLTVPPTAGQNIPQPAEPTTVTSPSLTAAKLNPNASSFVFKPNPSAAAFKPGQSSTGSPANRPSQLSPGPSGSTSENPFFANAPLPAKGVDPRNDFNPWKHGQPVPAASSVHPHWQYTGRKLSSFTGPAYHGMPPGGFDDDPHSPHAPAPHMLPPGVPPYGYRYQPGAPPHMQQQMTSPMFSPGPGFAPIPGGPMQPGHIPGGPQQNGMPMHFYQNGMPQNPQFLPPQHLQFNPNAQHRSGPGGPGPGPGGGPMYYPQHQIPTPQQTPQMHQNPLQPPPPPQFQQTSPLQAPQPQVPNGPGSFDANH